MKKYNISEKKVFCVFLLFLIFLFGVTVGTAYYTTITQSCAGGVCVVGQNITYHIGIVGGNEYIALEMRDSINQSAIALLQKEFNPLSDKRGDTISIPLGGRAVINISSIVPLPHFNDSFIYYYPCFTVAVKDDYILAKKGVYQTTHCYSNLNFTFGTVQCTGDYHCPYNTECRTTQCMPLSCGECQYIENHQCVSYSCCWSEQCPVHQDCRNNTCQNLECGAREQIFNHTCAALVCNWDESYVNNSCQKLTCGPKQAYVNNTCQDLACKEEEYAAEHQCKQLSCKDSEIVKEHQCIPLQCQRNEGIKNRQCVPLRCSFFEDMASHRCVFNLPRSLKLGLEIIALVVIILLAVLDVKNFKVSHMAKKAESK